MLCLVGTADIVTSRASKAKNKHWNDMNSPFSRLSEDSPEEESHSIINNIGITVENFLFFDRTKLSTSRVATLEHKEVCFCFGIHILRVSLQLGDLFVPLS